MKPILITRKIPLRSYFGDSRIYFPFRKAAVKGCSSAANEIFGYDGLAMLVTKVKVESRYNYKTPNRGSVRWASSTRKKVIVNIRGMEFKMKTGQLRYYVPELLRALRVRTDGDEQDFTFRRRIVERIPR